MDSYTEDFKKRKIKMWSLLAKSVLPSVFATVDRVITGKDEATKLKQEVQLALMASENEWKKSASDVIKAEASSESWLARNWRPITMLCFTAIIFNNYLLFPYMKLFGFPATMLDIPEGMWSLLTMGLSGYVVSRGAEKLMKTYKGQ